MYLSINFQSEFCRGLFYLYSPEVAQLGRVKVNDYRDLYKFTNSNSTFESFGSQVQVLSSGIFYISWAGWHRQATNGF